MKLVVGLGNPGKEYEQTRHNVGFLVIDELKRRGVSAHLLKPGTYMNRSGEAVKKEMAYYKFLLTDLIVVHDDADLPFGSFKLGVGRGSAGHNGVQSIIDALSGEKGFHRMRIGIGRPTFLDSDGNSVASIGLENWVLQRFSPEEEKKLAVVVKDAADAIENMLSQKNEMA